MSDGSAKGALILSPFGIGMYPLMIDSGIGKLVDLFLGNGVPAGNTKLLSKVRFKFGVIMNDDHISMVTFETVVNKISLQN